MRWLADAEEWSPALPHSLILPVCMAQTAVEGQVSSECESTCIRYPTPPRLHCFTTCTTIDRLHISCKIGVTRTPQKESEFWCNGPVAHSLEPFPKKIPAPYYHAVCRCYRQLCLSGGSSHKHNPLVPWLPERAEDPEVWVYQPTRNWGQHLGAAATAVLGSIKTDDKRWPVNFSGGGGDGSSKLTSDVEAK